MLDSILALLAAIHPPPSSSPPTNTRTIHPPRDIDIHTIIEKSATFVSKNGPEFERRIVANETGNARFNFLLPSDPYHAYYQHRVSELRTQLQSSKPDPSSDPSPAAAASVPAPPPPSEDSSADSSAQFRPPKKVLEPPETEQYTVRLPEEGVDTAVVEMETEMDEKDEPEQPMRIGKNLKRPAAERDFVVVSPITGELIPISEMAEHVRISLIDIFEEEVSNAVKAEIEKKDEQPKQVIWDGHTGSIGHTANRNDGRMLPGPAAPPPRPGVPSIRPLPLPPGMPRNMPPRYTPRQYSTGPMQRPGMMPPSMRHPGPPAMSLAPGHQKMTMGRPPITVNPPNMPPVPPPPGSQFTSLGMGRPYPPMPMPPPPNMAMVPPPPLPHGIPSLPPPDEALPPPPDEPEPKRPRVDDSFSDPRE